MGAPITHVRRNAVGYLALVAALGAVGVRAGDAGRAAAGNPAVARFALADATSTSQPSSIGARGRAPAPVVAKHGGFTDIPLTGDSWTQPGDELELVTGTMDVTLPAGCTGSFGNALVLSVDGKATTFASAPTAPASGTVSLPFVVGTLSEPGQGAQHKLSARFGNSCTKDGEDYTINDVKVDVLKFQ